jgi:sugar phosphate isomerase/epimerase
MSTLAINTVGDELEEAAKFCRTEGLGLEVSAFAFPDNLDGDMVSIRKRHKMAVGGITPILSHGPFFDLIATSPDSSVVALSRQRHEAALAASIEIGASFYIAHTNYNPLIRNPAYRRNWIKRTLEFWLPFAEQGSKHNVVICLENLWEPSPDIQAELISSGQHSNLRASFDNGHALVFSSIAATRWVETLGDTLAHCHLHDNSGELDEHKPVGDGKENWPEFLEALHKHAPRTILVAESDRLERNKQSIIQLRMFQQAAISPGMGSLRNIF